MAPLRGHRDVVVEQLKAHGHKGGILVTLDAVRGGIALGMDGLTFEEVRGVLHKALAHYDALERAQAKARRQEERDDGADA